MTSDSLLFVGDRCAPRLPIRPHLQAGRKWLGPSLECLLFSRIDGHYPVFEGYVPVDVALAQTFAGEA